MQQIAHAHLGLALLLITGACDEPEADGSSESGAEPQMTSSDTGGSETTGVGDHDASTEATESTGEADDACWQPDPWAYPTSCDQLCAQVLACNPAHAEADCRLECELIAPYLSAEAGQSLATRLPQLDCAQAQSFGKALDASLGPIILDGSLVPAEGNEAACEAVSQTLRGCIPGDTSMVDEFDRVCAGFAASLSAAAMQSLGSCAGLACPEIQACLNYSACFLDHTPVDP